MATRDDIIRFCDELLDVGSFADYGPNGLQVPGTPEVERVVTGVSAHRELIDRATAAGAQLLLVHHGLFWDFLPLALTEAMAERLRTALGANLSIAGYHLPLDAHPEIGNNALLAAELGVEVGERFTDWGYGGRLPEPMPVSELANRVQAKLDRPPLVFSYGPEEVVTVAILTGGAARYVRDAAARGYDCFVTGEADEPTKYAAKEAGIHFIAGGHYATETLGVRALAAKLASEFGIDWEFVDLPNPV